MKSKAFTLIEIIIVITIIGIITAVAILSYQGAYERQQVSVFSKDLLATAQHAKAEVKAGKKDETGLLCEGISFAVGEVPKKISMNYTDSCDLTTEVVVNLDQSSPNILVKSINLADSIKLLFVPPSGEMQVYGPDLLSGAPLVEFYRVNYSDLGFYFGVDLVSDRIYIEKNEEK